jgi:hypothetical protein
LDWIRLDWMIDTFVLVVYCDYVMSLCCVCVLHYVVCLFVVFRSRSYFDFVGMISMTSPSRTHKYGELNIMIKSYCSNTHRTGQF